MRTARQEEMMEAVRMAALGFDGWFIGVDLNMELDTWGVKSGFRRVVWALVTWHVSRGNVS